MYSTKKTYFLWHLWAIKLKMEQWKGILNRYIYDSYSFLWSYQWIEEALGLVCFTTKASSFDEKRIK